MKRQKREMNVRDHMREREKAKKYFNELMPHQKHELKDQMVLGDVDYFYWFDNKRPSRSFMNELDYRITLWEDTRGY